MNSFGCKLCAIDRMPAVGRHPRSSNSRSGLPLADQECELAKTTQISVGSSQDRKVWFHARQTAILQQEMRDQKFTLRCISVANLLVGFVSVVVQAVITTRGNDNFARIGIGIWAGIIYEIVGVVLWLSVQSKRVEILAVTRLWIALTITFSTALIGVSAIVINYEPHYSLIQEPATPNFLDAQGPVNWFQVCKEQFNNRCRDRVVMEAVLMACGAITLVINVLAGVV